MTSRLGLGDPGHAATLLAAAVDRLGDPAASVSEALVAALATDGVVSLAHGYADPERRLVVIAAAGWDQTVLTGRRTPLGEGVAGWVASRREAAVVADRGTDSRGDHLAGTGVPVAGVAIPVPARRRYVGGVLEVYADPPFAVAEDEIRVLRRLAAVLGVCLDAEHVATSAAVANREHLARSVIQAQEAERKRLAADIHDGISQRLAGLAFHLSAARDALGEDPAFASEQLDLARQLADLAGAEARAAIGGLRPPVLDDLGLAEGLMSLARGCPGIEVTVEIDGEYSLPEHVQTALYRIAQEALQNVLKHADTAAATIEMFQVGEAVALRVRDHGRGFDPAAATPPEHAWSAGGLGLPGMRERAEFVGGRLTVTARPGGGTTVEAIVPMPS
ncbi:MAG: GAF domain-containing sensor histidine kinase [Actinobacteria bacterium]|nr:GAF domain-containing sensor histidine kinase [Actinomycetota bacterium]MBI3688605.1 GAF domain-containing sensor histidine kinase [Actinomycetota bacterium]